MRRFLSWRTQEQAELALRGRLPPEAASEVGRALAFAVAHHGDQRRPTGAPYLEHLLEALEVAVCGAGVTDPGVLSAVVLHDVVEDTSCTLPELAAAFGQRVADLVGWVTIPEPPPGTDKAAAKDAYLRRLPQAPRDALLVKLADRASNVQTLRNLPSARARAYYAQTVEHIVPLAAVDQWFADWYACWLAEFADLAGPSPGSPPVAPAPAAAPLNSETPSQASNPTG
ncbi:MAG TPA: HD domain-containing protein [Streptosporangiaceae bacterium]|nr:HD domain-containing protein [Streptosporangiaceae bacterium]